MELRQNLFTSVSRFSLNAGDFHLPSPPVLIPGGPGCLPLLKVLSNTQHPLNLCNENKSIYW